MRFVLLLAFVSLAACRGPAASSANEPFSGIPPVSPPSTLEGVFMSCREIEGFSRRTLELIDGRFRFWLVSDVQRSGEPVKYPQHGSYEVEDRILHLHFDDGHEARLILQPLGDTECLWREEALSDWIANGMRRPNPYGILLRTCYDSVGEPLPPRPDFPDPSGLTIQ